MTQHNTFDSTCHSTAQHMTELQLAAGSPSQQHNSTERLGLTVGQGRTRYDGSTTDTTLGELAAATLRPILACGK